MGEGTAVALHILPMISLEAATQVNRVVKILLECIASASLSWNFKWLYEAHEAEEHS